MYQPTKQSEKFTKDFKLFSFQIEARLYDYCKFDQRGTLARLKVSRSKIDKVFTPSSWDYIRL